jgi:hypothetical protein
VARSVGESAERQHGSAGRATAVHRLVSGQGRSLCCQALCVQEKDRNFVAALLEARLVNAGAIHERLLSIEERRRPAADRAVTWLKAWIEVI